MDGNMLNETSSHLYELVYKMIMPEEVVDHVRRIKPIEQLTVEIQNILRIKSNRHYMTAEYITVALIF